MNRGIIGKRLLKPTDRVSNFSVQGTTITLEDIFEASYSNDGLTSEWIKNKYSAFSSKYPLKSLKNSFNFSAQTNAAQCCTMSSDGTKLYIASNTIVYTYNLSTAFDVTTAEFNSSWTILGETTAKGMYFKPDGTRLFIIGQTGDDITWYNLIEPWNVSSAVLVSQQLVGSTGLTGLSFDDTGTLMYVVDLTSDLVYRYALSEAWNPATLGVATTISILFATTTPSFIEFNSTGTKMYIGDNVTTLDKYILVFKLNTPFDVTTAVLQGRMSLMELLGGGFPTLGNKSVVNIEDMRFSNNGNNSLFLTPTDIWNVPLPSNREFENFSQTAAISYLNSVSDGQGIYFKPDGTRYYITDALDDVVYEYSMTTPWDISTSGLVRTERNLFPQDGNPTDIWFKPDGTKMYLIGNDTDSVYSYDLSEPWDISSAFYNSISLYVGYEELSPTGLCLSENGEYLFIVGSQKNVVYRYDLSTPWDIGTGILSSYSLLTTSTSEGNRSYYFPNTSSDYLSLTANSIYVMGTGDFTVESWIYLPVLNRPNPIIRAASNAGWRLDVNNENKVIWNKATTTLLTSNTSIQPNTWTHIAISRQGSNLRAFINGVLDTTIVDTTTYNENDELNIGNSGGNLLLGNLYGLRFVVGEALYTESFIKPTSAPVTTNNTVLKTAMYSSFKDGSKYNRNIIVQGAVTINTSFAFSGTSYIGSAMKTDGTKTYLINRTNYTIYQYSSTTDYKFINQTPESEFYFGDKSTSPNDFSFSESGHKLYIFDSVTKEIIQFGLSTPWEIDTASFEYDVLLSTEDTTPNKFTFNSDGKKLFVHGSTKQKVIEYNLTESWNIATSSPIWNNIVWPTQYGTSTGVSLEITPQDILFANDGYKMYTVGQTNDEIREYTLDIPYDPITAQRNTTDVISTLLDPQGIFINYDEGADKFYKVNSTRIEQFTLKTPRKLYSAIPDNVFFVPSPAIGMKDISFSNTGMTLYVLQDTAVDAINQYNLELPWNIGKLTSNGSYSIVPYGETAPTSMTFKRDGTKFYCVGITLDRVFEFNMSDPWNLNSAYHDILLNISTQDSSPQDIYFSSDGTKMYLAGATLRRVNQYNLAVPWEAGSASFYGSANVSTQEATMTGIAFSNTGSKMYVIGTTSDSVHEYDLSTPWDVTTFSFLQTRSISAQEITPQSLYFSNNGTIMYVMGTTSDNIHQYSLSTPYNISTSTFVRSRSILTQDTTMSGMYFKDDGTQLYLVGSTSDTVFTYNLSEAWNIATTSVSTTRLISAQQTVPNGISFSDDGYNMYIVGTTPVNVVHYRLSTAWDISTATYSAFNVGTQAATPAGLAFSNTGTKMYTSTAGIIHQYGLSTPWNVGTATFERSSANTIPLTTENLVTDIQFNDNGTKIFIAGTARDIVTTLEMSEAYNVSTIYVDPVNRYNVLPLDTTPTGLDFTPDGSSFIVTGTTNDRIHQVPLTTSWNLRSNGSVTTLNLPGSVLDPTSCIWSNNGNTLTVTTSTLIVDYPTSSPYSIANLSSPRFSVVTQDTAMNDIYFKPDGTSFYTVSSTTTGRVHQYNMNVAWQVATANFARSLTITTQEISPTGIWFRPEGNSMYVVGTANDTIYQYNLSSDWNIGTATFASSSLNINLNEATPGGLCFSNTGQKMYFVGATNDNIREYTLSTPWLVTSATLTRSVPIAAIDTTTTGLYIDPTSSYMALIGGANDIIQMYTFGEAGNIATLTPSSDRSVVGLGGSPSGLYLKPDGSILYVLDLSTDFVHQINLTESWNVNTGYYGVTTLPTGPFPAEAFSGVRYANNGYDLYAVGSTNDRIYQYKLGVPYTSNTITYYDSKSIANVETVPTGISIDNDASQIFAIGTGSSPQRISRYVFVSNNDISTLQTANLSLLTQDSSIRGIDLSNNDSELIVVGSTVTPNLHRYSLTYPNVISSASFVESVAVNTGLTPNKLTIQNQTEKSIFISSSDGNIIEYSLNSPNTLTGSKLKNSLNVLAQNTVTSGSFIKPDGSKFYTIDTANDKIYQYGTANNYVLDDYALEEEFDYNLYGVQLGTVDGSSLRIAANSLLNIYNSDFTIRFNFYSTTSGLVTPHLFQLGATSLNRSALSINASGKLLYTANTGVGALTSITIFDNPPIETGKWYHAALVKSANNYTVFLNGKSLGTANTTLRPTGNLGLSIGFQNLGGVVGNVFRGLRVQNFEIVTDETLYTSNFEPEKTTADDYISKPIVKSANTLVLLAQSPNIQDDSNNQFSLLTTSVTPLKIIANTATAVSFSNNGSNMYVFGSDNDLLTSYSLSSNWNVSSASISYGANNSTTMYYTDDTREYSPGGIFVNKDGTDLYVVGTNGAWKVYQFKLNTPNELNSISDQFKQFDISDETKQARGITFKPDGTQMYICGGNTVPVITSGVYSYNLSTPWDITTAEYYETLSTTANETFPTGIRFREDGTSLYVIGTAGADITPYKLSTPWRISTATAETELKLFTVLTTPTQTTLSQITAPQDFVWGDSGNYGYFIGSTTISSNTINVIQHRSLNNAYSTGIRDGVITLPLDSNYYTGNISGISIKVDGKKMWAVDASNATIYEYILK